MWNVLKLVFLFVFLLGVGGKNDTKSMLNLVMFCAGEYGELVHLTWFDE